MAPKPKGDARASSSETPTPTDAPKKRGSPSDFQGAQMEFLRSNLDAYAEHSKKKTLIRDFWPSLFHDYWRLFPWRLPLTEDPPAGCPPEPNASEAAFKALDLNLTEAQQAEKSKIQTEIKGKIKRWFNRQRPGAMGIYANPYFAHLKLLRAQHGNAPKRMPDYQFYFQHKDFKRAVAVRFTKDSADVPKKHHMALRCEIAREMLAAEPQEVRTRITDESTAAHDVAMEKYSKDTEGVPSADPEIQAECREKFLNIVSPLLQGLQAYTGYTLNLTAAHMEDGELKCASANAGTVGGKAWSKWDETGYTQMLTGFGRFVHALHVESLGLPLTAEPLGVAGNMATTSEAPALAASSGSGSLGMIGAQMLPGPITPNRVPILPPTGAAAADVEMGPPPPPPLPPLDEDDDEILSGEILPFSRPRPSFLTAMPTTATTNAPSASVLTPLAPTPSVSTSTPLAPTPSVSTSTPIAPTPAAATEAATDLLPALPSAAATDGYGADG
ncbi:hypothetical protein B0H16DRAFT_1731617 [Mycena metata]|uniref:Uncharacterized protein n=1 Tax=Mycena metata TaxID=1033252 RepID=A0AAD7MVT3_9AGAR|nr:hypothetical protein B0H16DRAFT_1731617 [Mycena metata]